METWSMIAGVLGGIVLLGNVGVVIGKWLAPALNVKKTQEETLKRVEDLEEHEAKDLERLLHLQEMSKLQCQSMICLINHMIDGNGIENMKQTRDEIQTLLIKM